jgi:hypothetical protein
MTEFKFYLPPINNVRGAQNTFITGTLSDQRKFLKINIEGKRTYVKRAEVVIAKKIMTGTDKSDVYHLPTSNSVIGPPGVVSVSEINYAFVDNTVYTIKIKAQLVDENNEVKTYFAEFGSSSSYEYLHRIDGGDKFTLPDLVVVNETLVEGAAGSNITVKCPINFVNQTNDSRIPTNVSFLFDEVNIYPNQVSTPNTESLSSYSIDLLPFDPSGNYTLPQTSDNKLINDKAYFVFVVASYSDGFSITGQFSRPLHVIANPVIDSVIAYGLASDQSDAGAATISSVMNVYMTPGIVSNNLPAKSGNITFELSQGGVVMYKADMPVSTTVVDQKILYTVLKGNLVKVWTTTAPTQKSNGSYEYDVSAIIDHYSLKPSESILKKSVNVSKTFTSDIVSLPSVVALNSWIAGANVAGAGDRTVDISNATTASGYALAPELGLVGKFSKNDFYGSGITDGFFKDLDAVDANGNALTNHKFTVSVNGSAAPATELHQIQGHDGKTDQEMYIELFNSTINGDAVSSVKEVETILTTSQVQVVKADSNAIISNNSQGGWTILNTGPNTNGATGGKLPKVNLYFYSNTTAAANQTASNSFKLNQATGIGMYTVFHQNATAKEYPFFIAYTTPMDSGNKASWYRSKVFFGPQTSDGDTVADAGKVGLTLVYTGTDDTTLFPEIPSNRRVRYEIMYGGGLTNSFGDETVFSNEYVNLLSLATSSNATTSQDGSFNFRLLETGMFTSNSNFGRVKLRYNVLSPNKYTNANGSFPNLPGPASTLGSAQEPIYFLIPSTGLFAQTDSVKVSVAIEPRAGETTRPSATESNAVVAVSKVNQYVMTSVPRFSQGTLTVPINNPTSSEHYFTSAIFTSNLAAPNDLKEVSVSNGGVFNIAVENPNIRGANCDYQVRYKISDPNASGSITGPISATYSVMLNDPPGLDNFSVTNFAYKTFNNDSVSSFNFDVTFQTVGTRSVDGVIVYFQSTNDDEDASNDIPLTQLMDVQKSAGSSQTNVSYTLQTAAAANATLTEGVTIKDKDAVASSNKWLNFRSGKIVFKPYIVSGIVKEIQSVQLAITMFNIPVIPVPTNLTLTGGVKESYAATSAAWNNALSTYASIGSSATASYKLVLNDSDVSGTDVNTNHGYTIDLSGVDAESVVTLKLQTRITASDSTIYLSDAAELSFTVASIAVTGMTNDVKRGSNDTVLRVSRGNYAITPAGGANVTEVKLIDNQVVANTNPEAATVKVLTCTSTADAVQPASTVINVYDLAADGYALGDDLDLQYRLKAGVNYTTKYGVAASPSTTSSTPLFLTLASPTLKYIVATKPELQLESTYRVMSSGAYNGRIAINATINAKGLQAEGLLSVVFVLAQEGNFTNPDLSDSGVQYVIAFESVTGLTKSYTVGPNASLVPSSTDNLGATEVHELSVTDVDGFAEGAGARTLVMGNLLANDASTLYLDATGFDASRPITAVSVVATRLGNDIVFKELTHSA